MTESNNGLLPKAFLKQTEAHFGKEELAEFARAINNEPVTSIRINPFKKPFVPENSQPVPWSSHGHYLKQRPVFTLDPVFHAGGYYVQEASSMFLQHILNTIQAPKGFYLDLCAAPGGKSTILSSYLEQEGTLVANEVIGSRSSILKENIIKWGLGNTLVTNNDPSHFLAMEAMFDLVLVDAPCSGEGMFRKDPTARKEWSAENVRLCAARQERILEHAGALVKADGYLIYSTCTFNRLENEDNLKYLIDNFAYEPVEVPLEANWNIKISTSVIDGKNYFGYRFYPHLVEGEGFFITVLKRSSEVRAVDIKKIKNRKHSHIQMAAKEEIRDLQKVISLPDSGTFYKFQDSFFWWNPSTIPYFEITTAHLNIKYFGIELGKPQRNQFIPNHEWAVSILEKKGFPQTEVDLHNALSFLRKEEVLPYNCPKGWVLLTYKGFPIGWIKNLGNRSNNYYPKEWRIRMR